MAGSKCQNEMSLGEYLQILGELAFCEKEVLAKKWIAHSLNEQELFLEKINQDGYGVFALFKIGTSLLSDSWVKKIKLQQQQQLLFSVVNKVALDDLISKFEKVKIHFALLKGTDLAYRRYPFPSLRPFGDWDILFAPDDINRARKFLLIDGWSEVFRYQKKTEHHHFLPLKKNNFVLEPHQSLPKFTGVSSKEIWDETVPITEGRCQHILPLSLNLLLCARHAAEQEYRVISLTKLLLDVAFLLQSECVNWTEVRELSTKLYQPYPGNLFAAFPEFFPEKKIEDMHPDFEQARCYRQIFETRELFLDKKHSEIYLNDASRLSWKWFSHCLYIFANPEIMRYKYNLPNDGAYFRLFFSYIRDGIGKFYLFVSSFVKKNNRLHDYMKAIDLAEKKS